MHRCRCSTRALELFVRDVAGLSIRTPRPPPPVRLPRPPTRRLETVTAAHADNHFVPFEGGGIPPQPAVALEQPEHRLSTIDAVSLPHTHSTTAHNLQDAQPPILHQPSSPTAGAVSRKDARLARKQSRKQAGTYAPIKRANERRARGVEVDQLDTVLSKIDELEGPDVTAPTPQRQDSQKPPRANKEQQLPHRRLNVEAQKTTENPHPQPKREPWQVQKAALEHKFGEQGWQPRKRLSPDTLEGIRALHASNPTAYPTATLAEHFKVAPEAIRRILKSKWKPSEEEAEDRRVRWERRGVKKWADMAELGVRPPAKWRAMGAGSEKGLKEERVPKRRKRRSEGLSWDEVVGEFGGGGGGFAERIL
ncbi:hypothetical protein EJ03DRAFT_329962 [Teratosphaeria nubilosa]|uniref:Required for respiratory growth protein 9, mitochondrial n=1 Tax=Teratosphaeria nubilosa TaxID=161662 RepID=A0A6G1L2X0_9PEZI|nr:hypothetical protein EJ03DRAFT_329962 [Teratosphaeria nubilosa]